jgi:hypothetical protein
MMINVKESSTYMDHSMSDDETTRHLPMAVAADELAVTTLISTEAKWQLTLSSMNSLLRHPGPKILWRVSGNSA